MNFHNITTIKHSSDIIIEKDLLKEEDLMKELMNYVEGIKDEIIGYRRDFHKYPETGWTEVRTASIIIHELISYGYDVKYGRDVIDEESRMGVPSGEILWKAYERAKENGGKLEYIEDIKDGFTGVVGTMKFGEGPVVGLRFDIDALNILESSSDDHLPFKEEFASVNEGVMHSCGHDGHAAIGLGVAKTIAMNKDKFKAGSVKLIFQPAEEGVRGAKSMVTKGILDDVDYVIGGHIMANEEFGSLVCGNNGFLATTKLDVNFIGLPSHAGGAPNEGKNSLLAACTAVLNLHSIPRHNQGASRINVGSLIVDGDRNIIPHQTTMKVETRGQTTEINEYIKKYAERIIKNSAQMHDCKYEIDYVGESICATSDEEIAGIIQEIGKHTDGITSIQLISDKPSGSEDFMFMVDRVQKNGGRATYFTLGGAQGDFKPGHHTQGFDFYEEILPIAVKIFTNSLEIILSNNK